MNKLLTALTIIGALVGGAFAAEDRFNQANEVKQVKQEAALSLKSTIIMVQQQRVDDLTERKIQLDAKQAKTTDEVKIIYRLDNSIKAAQKMIDTLEGS